VPIPEFSDVIEWLTIKTLVDADISISDTDAGFVQLRPEIDKKVVNWCVSVKTHLAGVLRESFVRSGYTIGTPIVATIDGDSEAGPFMNLAPEVQLFLRADRLFHSYDSVDYNTLMWSIRKLTGQVGAISLKQPLDVAKIQFHPAASTTTRVLLNCLGRPENLSRSELQALDERFVCGRCGDNVSMTWARMVGF
jgi:hypothetical protein